MRGLITSRSRPRSQTLAMWFLLFVFASQLGVTIKVDGLIQPTLAWQNGTPVSVDSPGANDALAFLLSNSSNGTEASGLTRTNGPPPLPAGNHTPQNGSIGSIYLETDGTPSFQPTDTPYAPGVNAPNLAPDVEQILYVISNAPGEVRLSAASLIASAADIASGLGLAISKTVADKAQPISFLFRWGTLPPRQTFLLHFAQRFNN